MERNKPILSILSIEKALLIGVVFFYAFELSAKRGYGFIENKNQWPASIDYMASIPGGRMTVQASGFGYYFFDYKRINASHSYAHGTFEETDAMANNNFPVDARHVRVNFLNSNPKAIPRAAKKSSTYFNYFLGRDPQRWASKAHAFEEIKYADFYPGIDLILKTEGEHVKYDLVVDAGADPSCIRIEYAGAVSLSLFDGDLIVDAGLSRITEKKPISYQVVNGVKKYIPTAYKLVGTQVYFAFPDGYNPCYELVIDPLLIFSTYSGFTADNWGASATPGEGGNHYSSGVTTESSGGFFGVTPGVFQTAYAGGSFDIGILKYDSLGQKLLYASYLGGGDSESPHSLLMNHDEDLLVLGTTGSSNFPVTANTYDDSFGGGPAAPSSTPVPYAMGVDIFIAKMSKEGTELMASTYLGGSGNDGINTALSANYGDELRGDIVIDKDGNIFIASVTSSQNFDLKNSFSTTYKGGGTDALIAKLSAGLDTMYWSAVFGGSASEAAYSIKLDSTEDTLFVAGGTSSRDFPTTQGAYNTDYSTTTIAGGWIAKLASDGTALKAATLISATTYSQAYFIDLNKNGEVYVYGQQQGTFPVTAGTYSNPNSGQFLQKYTNNLSTLLYSTTIGSGRGSIDISPTAFSVNSECGNVYMAGWGGGTNTRDPGFFNRRPLGQYTQQSSTIGMPTTSDAFQRNTRGSDFYFIVLKEDASKLLYGTFMGGNFSEIHVDGGTSRFDKNGIVYHAVCAGCGGFSADFPTTAGAWSSTNNSRNCNNAAFKFDLSTLRARVITNSVALDQPNIRTVCLPDSKVVFQNRSVGGQVYQWDFGDGTTEMVTNKDDIEHEYLAEGTYTVSLKAIDLQSCVGEDIDLVTIRVNSSMGYVGPDQNICYGHKATLEAGGGISYSWQLDTGESLSSSSQLQVSPEDTTLYEVKIRDAQGCIKSDTVTVNVVPQIDIQFSLSKEYDCISRPRVKLINRTSADENISVDFGDGKIATNGEEVHEYEQDGNYRIRLVGKKGLCSYEKTADVSIFTLTVPNVITPQSSPGLNDNFKIIYGKKNASEARVNISLSIYNRWGKVVFQDTQYKDNWSAENLKGGVYYYDLKIEDHNSCKGWVHVIK